MLSRVEARDVFAVSLSLHGHHEYGLCAVEARIEMLIFVINEFVLSLCFCFAFVRAR
jgi:hypothetical protein